jgi:hypothetical protein
MRLITILAAYVLVLSCAAQVPQQTSRWTKFVQVEGQPEPVPEEWVGTAEGEFAHSIKLPHPLSKDSGYRSGMTSDQYFDHLCKNEAGEFIYQTVADVDGLYFVRPPNRPTDDDLEDRYKLEAPEIERTFQLHRATPEERAKTFVNPPWAQYSYYEEPNTNAAGGMRFVRVFGYKQDATPMKEEPVSELKSRYALIWRGLKRHNDREMAIAGSEWITFDLKTKQVLAVQRNFAQTGRTRNTTEGIWWLNANHCPSIGFTRIFSDRFYKFAVKSLKPALRDTE